MYDYDSKIQKRRLRFCNKNIKKFTVRDKTLGTYIFLRNFSMTPPICMKIIHNMFHSISMNIAVTQKKSVYRKQVLKKSGNSQKSIAATKLWGQYFSCLSLLIICSLSIHPDKFINPIWRVWRVSRLVC